MPCEAQQIGGAETALTRGQHNDGALRREIGPLKWNFALAALLVEERYPALTTVFFLCERLKLTTCEQVKWLRDPKRCVFGLAGGDDRITEALLCFGGSETRSCHPRTELQPALTEHPGDVMTPEI